VIVRRFLDAIAEVPRRGLQARLGGDPEPRPGPPPRAGGMGRLAGLALDLRYAARSLRRRPGWTAAIVATLALGIGANTAIFSVFDATVLSPSPWSDADRLVFLRTRLLDMGATMGVLPDDLERWRREVDAFARVEARAVRVAVLDHVDGARRVDVATVSPGFLDAVGVEPVTGRFLRADDGRPGAEPVALMPEALWRGRYGADPDVVGRTVALDGVLHVVVGVVPDVRGSDTLEAFHVPLTAAGAERDRVYPYGWAWLLPGVTVEEARARLEAVSAGRHERLGPYVGEIDEPSSLFRDDEEYRSALLALLAAVFLVLAIACVNVANLLLAAGGARRGELAVRAAMGASRLRLARFLLVECLLLSTLGGVLGVGVAFGGIEAMRLMRPGGALGWALDAVVVDGAVLAYAIAVSLGSGLAFGLLPALRGTASGQASVLKGADPRGGDRRDRVRGALVTVETALSVVLLVTAGLTLRSFVELRLTDPGFDADRILSVGISMPEARYPTAAQKSLFFDELAAEARAVPGVQAVTLGIGAAPPTDLAMGGDLVIEGRDTPAALQQIATTGRVQEGFLEFMGIPLLAGRDLSAADVRNAGSSAERPVVINRTMASRYWPDDDAVGARFRFTGQTDERWNRVVGVAGDVTQLALDDDRRLHVYVPLSELDRRYAELLVRLRPGVAPPVADLRTTIRRLDPQIPTDGLDTAAARLVETISDSRFRATLFGSFGLVAVALAALGISGVAAYTVTRRTREMGIRLALGAAPRDVRRLVVLQGAAPVAVGIVLGILLAVGVTRLMTGFLHEVPPLDPTTFLATVVTLGAVGAAATWVPARRATGVDPVATLRSE